MDRLLAVWAKAITSSPNSPSIPRRRSARLAADSPNQPAGSSIAHESAPAVHDSLARSMAIPPEGNSSADPTATKRISGRKRDISSAELLTTPEVARSRRVSFGRVLRISVEEDSACQICSSEEDAREPDVGRYYPASAAQKAAGCEFAKVAPKPHEEPDVFCACADGCKASCPCHANGIGCWYEGWGCGCSALCQGGPTANHFFDEVAIRKARRTVLRAKARVSKGTVNGTARCESV